MWLPAKTAEFSVHDLACLFCNTLGYLLAFKRLNLRSCKTSIRF